MTATAVNYAKTLYELSVSTRSRYRQQKKYSGEVPGLAESLRTHWCLLKQRAE